MAEGTSEEGKRAACPMLPPSWTSTLQDKAVVVVLIRPFLATSGLPTTTTRIASTSPQAFSHAQSILGFAIRRLFVLYTGADKICHQVEIRDHTDNFAGALELLSATGTPPLEMFYEADREPDDAPVLCFCFALSLLHPMSFQPLLLSSGRAQGARAWHDRFPNANGRRGDAQGD